ncbi:unnamed protein product [Rhizophagus irregularis]|uniref:Uncharacterized protein n=1 Tax=Rhizophagus irregularis TaxID=588596 RepID=A0A915YNA0_9GLOM|nr:unnamed protein product [Rhizophagus irregularis]
MNGSALGWASEDWKSKEFVQHSGGLPKIGNPKNSFGTGVTSEEWKKPSFVQCQEGFRVPKNEKNQDSFSGLSSSEEQQKIKILSGVSGGIPKNRIPKDSFLSVLGHWIYSLTFGSWALDIWVSTSNLYLTDRVSTSNFWLGSSSYYY